MNTHRLLIIIGTRPELIKVAPVIMELKKRGYTDFKVVNTGQHRELLDIYWKIFDIQPDYNLEVLSPNQSLASLTSKVLLSMNSLISDLATQGQKPEYILGQGDTTTVMATSIAAFYNNVKFFHLEAGLRSFDMNHPYPEEFNRKVAGILADIHFAPTERSKNNLIKEGVFENRIRVVGNTVVDSLNFISQTDDFKNTIFTDSRIGEAVNSGRKTVLITFHRRENQNENIGHMISSICKLAVENPSISFVWPVHANPLVREPILNSQLSSLNNVILTEPLNYIELLKVISVSEIILTDSGGIQEEAPSFSKPVLVLREVTERPEAVDLGLSKLVGCDPELIVTEFYNFRPDYNKITNPYGDGKAAEKVVDIYLEQLSYHK